MTHHVGAESPLVATLREVAAERIRQNAKWGEQNHPNGAGDEYIAAANEARTVCAEAFAQGVGTWRDVLAEEVYEAFAETDPVLLRAELIQVAAVAAAWVDRKTAS